MSVDKDDFLQLSFSLSLQFSLSFALPTDPFYNKKQQDIVHNRSWRTEHRVVCSIIVEETHRQRSYIVLAACSTWTLLPHYCFVSTRLRVAVWRRQQQKNACKDRARNVSEQGSFTPSRKREKKDTKLGYKSPMFIIHLYCTMGHLRPHRVRS